MVQETNNSVAICADSRYETSQLQFLRFLGFLNVYIVHADKWEFFFYPSACAGAGAVSFFIMLSGFLTGYGAYGKEYSLSLRQEAIYLGKKLRKFYPLYFLTNISALLYSGWPEMIAGGKWEDLIQQISALLADLLFLQCWFPSFGSFNPVSWTLATLMFLYVFNIPMCHFLCYLHKKRNNTFLFAGLAAAMWVALVAYCYLFREDMGYWHYVFPIARMAEYFSAMIVGFFLHSVRPCIRRGKVKEVLFTLLEAGALALWYETLLHPGSPWRQHNVNWLVPNMLLLLTFTCGQGWLSIAFRWRPLVRLGNISFECYLIHGIIIALFGFFHEAPQQTAEANMFAFLFCLFLTIGMALLLSRGKLAAGKPVPGTARLQ